MKQFALGATALSLFACNANEVMRPVPQQARFEGLTLDLERMRAVTPVWTSQLVDCSDALVECLEAPGYFLVAMKRTCAKDVAWEAGGYSYRAIAPAAHYGLPSGSYMSTKYPHVHWRFGSPIERGFSRWARTVETPGDARWDTNSAVEEYEVRVVSADPWFRCT